MMKIFIFIGLMAISPSEEIKYSTDPILILQFAESLESEGDYYRAVSEYKRFLYFSKDTLQSDKILYKISSLYEKMGKPENALDILMRIQRKEEKKYLFELGKVHFLMKNYENARSFWNGNDTLRGWTYLKEKDFSKAKKFLGHIDNLHSKKPILAAFLSSLVPGLGRVYAGRSGDGVSSFLLTVSSGLSAYKYYRQGEKVPAVVFGSIGLFFYLGDIYGSVLSVKLYNEKKAKDFIGKIEARLGLMKWLE
ncbi:MAG: tetratricopeptide repeat protein [Candidatus Edwardsbacteria bacterium]